MSWKIFRVVLFRFDQTIHLETDYLALLYFARLYLARPYLAQLYLDQPYLARDFLKPGHNFANQSKAVNWI